MIYNFGFLGPHSIGNEIKKMSKRKMEADPELENDKKSSSLTLVDAWINVSHALLNDIAESDIESMLDDESAMADMVGKSLNRWLNTRPLSSLKQRIDEYAIDIVVFPNGSKCRTLGNEPIYFAPTLKFITELDDQLVSRKKRYLMFLVNVQKLKELFNVVNDAILNSASGLDSGMVDLTDDLETDFVDEQPVNRKFLKFSLMTTLLSLHSLGHFDLFVKHHFAFYDNHKQQSALHQVQRQLKAYQLF
ncbi:hypothetical protein HDE_00935 [Halotydeus destructor]|nr:hypothetical protein HDE_00935 [Halotydeus destructor]